MFTITDLCILCLTNKSNLKNILTKDSDGVNFEEKLKYFIHKHIEIQSEVSMFVCLPCSVILNYVYNYKRLCLTSITTFNSFIHKLKSTGKPCRHLQVKLIDLNINDEICGNERKRDSTTTENYKVDSVTVQTDPNKDDAEYRHKPKIIGKTLGKRTSEMEYLHIFNNAKNNNVPEENIIAEVSNILYDGRKCELADEIVKEKLEDFYDIIDTESKLDNDTFSNETDSNEEPTLTKTDNADKLKNQNVDDKNQHKCNVCQKIFPLRSKYEIHCSVSTGDHPYECPSCEKNYIQTDVLNIHKRQHTQEKLFECEVCHKIFYNKNTLSRHKNIHNNIRPHKCTICGKAFARNNDLTVHFRIHTGHKPFQCQVCQYKCTQASHLRDHMLSHTNEKPFKCKHCDYRCRRADHFKFHMCKHTGERPYQCNLCEYKCIRSDVLKQHMLIHVKDKPYVCEVCEYKCTRPDHLKVHMRKHAKQTS